MEPKVLYRAAVEQVPVDAYHLPLDKAEVLKTGKDVTIVSYGTPLYTCSAAIAAAERDFGCSVELIDLRTIYPWDRETVLESVKKTGRAIVVHESMMNAGVGAEVAATIQERAFLRLEAPVKRVTGWATHTGLVFEKFIIPDVTSKFVPAVSTRDLLILNRGVRCNQKDDRLLNNVVVSRPIPSITVFISCSFTILTHTRLSILYCIFPASHFQFFPSPESFLSFRVHQLVHHVRIPIATRLNTMIPCIINNAMGLAGDQ
jgi:hypothetical protein